MIKVFIDGSEGTTGLKIHGLIESMEGFELMKADPERRKDPAYRKEMINAASAVFLCLPDAAASESALMCENPDTVILDTSTAHRTAEGWAYGFPELSPEHASMIKRGKRIAVPGCHASGAIALLYPLRSAGIMPADYPVTCMSVTGYSGGGKKMIAQYEAADRPEYLKAPRQYGLSQTHKHLAEIKKVCSLSDDIAFMPVVGDYYCGMSVTVPLLPRMLTGKPTKAEIHALLTEHYGKGNVKVLPLYDEAFLNPQKLAGDVKMEISVFGNDDRILLNAQFDNLGKGASGAAVQCMELALGRKDI